jgi:hypothetical protein
MPVTTEWHQEDMHWRLQQQQQLVEINERMKEEQDVKPPIGGTRGTIPPSHERRTSLGEDPRQGKYPLPSVSFQFLFFIFIQKICIIIILSI